MLTRVQGSGHRIVSLVVDGNECSNWLAVAGEVRDLPGFDLSECLGHRTGRLTGREFVGVCDAHIASLRAAGAGWQMTRPSSVRRPYDEFGLGGRECAKRLGS